MDVQLLNHLNKYIYFFLHLTFTIVCNKTRYLYISYYISIMTRCTSHKVPNNSRVGHSLSFQDRCLFLILMILWYSWVILCCECRSLNKPLYWILLGLVYPLFLNVLDLITNKCILLGILIIFAETFCIRIHFVKLVFKIIFTFTSKIK